MGQDAPLLGRSVPRVPVWVLIAWMVFAVVIAVGTAMKKDTVRLTAPGATLLEGKIVSRGADGSLVFRELREKSEVKPGEDRWVERRFAAAEVATVTPLGARSVTGNYRLGSELWRRQQPMYSAGVHGFLYFPHAAIIFLPFEVLPPVVGEVLWRWAGLLVYAWGVWRMCVWMFGAGAPKAFLFATALAIPAALGSAQNGQTNLAMGGLLALGVVDAAAGQRWRSTLWFMLALACKPIALPVILLTAAVYPSLIVPLGVGVIVFVLAPFVHPSPTYVLEQYVGAVRKMMLAADPAGSPGGQADAWFSDLRGLLRDFGLPLKEEVLTPVRAAFALVFLGACLWMRRRVGEPVRALYLLALGCGYTMIFNPRTEGVTYAIMGPPAAVLATVAILNKRTLASIGLIAYCLILQFSMQVTGPLTGKERKYWLRPLCTMGLVGYVVVCAARRPRRETTVAGEEPSTPTQG